MKRIKSAFKTNDAQISSVILLSGLNVATTFMMNAPWWGYIPAAMFWVALAFICNLIDPLP